MLGGEKTQEVGNGGEGRGGARSVMCVCGGGVCVRVPEGLRVSKGNQGLLMVRLRQSSLKSTTPLAP